MDFINAIFLFCFGSVLASFLNLCVYRIEKNESVKGIFVGRSFCEKCRKELNWKELIPIFSFLHLKGKCSSCGVHIGLFNLFSELILGITFLTFFFLTIPYYFYIFTIILYFFAVYDFHYRGIPKSITDFVLISSFLYWFFFLLLDYKVERFYPIFLFFFFWFLILIFSRKKTLFGFGDIIILAILAFWLEIEILLMTLFISFSLGGIWGILLIIKDRKNFKKYIPFIPFVFFGFVLAVTLYYYDSSIFAYIFSM